MYYVSCLIIIFVVGMAVLVSILYPPTHVFGIMYPVSFYKIYEKIILVGRSKS